MVGDGSTATQTRPRRFSLHAWMASAAATSSTRPRAPAAVSSTGTTRRRSIRKSLSWPVGQRPCSGSKSQTRWKSGMRVRGLLGQAGEEILRERRAPGGVLVLEVDVGPLPVPHVADTTGPGVQVGRRVVRAAQAEVAERRRVDRRSGEALGVGDTEGGSVVREDAVGFVGERGRILEPDSRGAG